MDINFDPNAAENQGDFNRTLVPEGRYLVALEEAIEKSTAKGNGTCLHMTFAILEGDYKGSHVKSFPIVDHVESRQVGQGRRQISAICRACQRPSAKSTDDLVGIPLFVDVEIDKGFNRITAYYSHGDGRQVPMPARQATAAASNDLPF